YFCNPRCREKFAAEPSRYLQVAPSAHHEHGHHAHQHPAHTHEHAHHGHTHARHAPTQQPDVTYVCPMDPEVRQSTPGSCPKCGMALEPELPAVTTRTEYVCPMHPEVVKNEPGAC